MTNPTPDYSFKVKFDSSADANNHQLPSQKLNLLTNQGGVLQDAILSPETALLGMDLKISTACSSSSPLKSVASASIIKKPSSSPNKRKLTFKVDEQDEVIEEVYSYPWPSDVDDNDIWWMDDEMDELLTEAMMVADHYTKKRKDWQNKIKSMLKCIAGCTASTKASPKNKCPGPAGRSSIKASDLDFVVDSEARGLELYIHPIFQKNREKAIRGVVKVQADYNAAEQKKGKADPELRVKVLRAQSLKLTNLGRLMAKTMADGDRRAAMKGEKVPVPAAPEEEEEAMPLRESSAALEKPTLAKEYSEDLVVLSCRDVCRSEELKDAKPAPRPRSRSPMRTLSPRRQPKREIALKELQEQDHQRLMSSSLTSKMGSSGGIGSLKAALEDMPGDEREC